MGSRWDPKCVFNFLRFFERTLYKSNYRIFISSWCGTHTKIRSKLVDIVTAGSQKITLWGPQRTPLGILRVKQHWRIGRGMFSVSWGLHLHIIYIKPNFELLTPTLPKLLKWSRLLMTLTHYILTAFLDPIMFMSCSHISLCPLRHPVYQEVLVDSLKFFMFILLRSDPRVS